MRNRPEPTLLDDERMVLLPPELLMRHFKFLKTEARKEKDPKRKARLQAKYDKLARTHARQMHLDAQNNQKGKP